MQAKKTTQRQGFKVNEFIVYPAHGVGQILAIEEQEVAGAKLELFVINFIKDKMTLRVPTAKIVSVGMRKLAEPAMVKRALETLKGRARIKRTMWSRRAQEYEAKINSGAATLGTPIFGYIIDRTGSYALAWETLAVTVSIGIVGLALLLKEPKAN